MQSDDLLASRFLQIPPCGRGGNLINYLRFDPTGSSFIG